MARIKGIDIPNDKHILISLTYIFGIGRETSKKILKAVNIKEDTKTADLSIDDIGKINNEISKYIVEGDLRRSINMNIKNKMDINCYQGVRHKKGLPVRGQRTSSNARTRKGKKGKVIANKKK